LSLPPYSPECNPAERLWTWIRERVANKVFKSIESMKESVINIINSWDKYKHLLYSMLNYHWWNEAVNVNI